MRLLDGTRCNGSSRRHYPTASDETLVLPPDHEVVCQQLYDAGDTVKLCTRWSWRHAR